MRPNGWILGLLVAYLIRGALALPLFRDGDAPVDAVDDSVEARIRRRLLSSDSKVVRGAGKLGVELVGFALIAAAAFAILDAFPGSCFPDFEAPEYRAR